MIVLAIVYYYLCFFIAQKSFCIFNHHSTLLAKFEPHECLRHSRVVGGLPCRDSAYLASPGEHCRKLKACQICFTFAKQQIAEPPSVNNAALLSFGGWLWIAGANNLCNPPHAILKPRALRYGFVGSIPTRAFALEMENLVQRWYLIGS